MLSNEDLLRKNEGISCQLIKAYGGGGGVEAWFLLFVFRAEGHQVSVLLGFRVSLPPSLEPTCQGLGQFRVEVV